MRSGTLTADNATEALARIADSNLVPVDLQLVGNSKGGALARLRTHYLPVPPTDLIIFTKQLNTMVRVGIPMTQALGILRDQTEQPRLKRLAGIIRDDVEGGSSLSAAAGKHPDVFSSLFCSMIEAGETSGTLPDVLDRLVYLIEHEAQVKAEIKSALRYPMIVVGALVAAFVVMVGFVIPRFVAFFDKQGLVLPLPTRICIAMSEFFTSYGLWVLLGAGIAGLMAHHYFNRTERGRLSRDRALIAMPLIGPVLVKAAMSRFASIFAILQASGVLILDALRILTETVGNAAISSEFVKVRELLEEGHGVAGPLSSSKYFPPMLINMVKIGEESGRLDEMLRHVSEHYDSEIRHTIKKMTDAIGPILIISLTVVVGFFALAIYMPMWELTEMVNKK
ncbi:type II secretory pathway, component PulF [Haloferula helveola]|uniref:Type II secretory pathway, component PulF n=1 Tax=Haloferula helveola TaxID=490095 RepID=A0ABM7RB78_9BACT|nr:type II secretory pathway, component PulF [Haloferula helveola]